MSVATYTPAAISLTLLVGYLLGVAVFYSWISLPSIYVAAAFPGLFWFIGSWAVGVGQLGYGIVRRRLHAALSGTVTLALFGVFVLILEQGWVLTV